MTQVFITIAVIRMVMHLGPVPKVHSVGIVMNSTAEDIALFIFLSAL